MKKFILRIIGFFVLLIFVGNSINIINLLFFKQVIFYRHDLRWVPNLKDAPNLIFMGSSTIRYGVSPKSICNHSPEYAYGEVVNVAFDAATPIQNYYVYKMFDINIDRSAIIIYGVDPWIFSERYYRYDSRMQVYWNLQQRYHAYYHNWVGLYSIFWGGNVADQLHTLFYNTYKKYLSSTDIGIPKDFGAEQLKQIPKNFADPVASWFNYDRFKFSDLQFRYLAKLQHDVQKKGMTFVLLFLPKRSDWRKDYITNCQEIENTFVEKLNSYLSENIMVGHVDDIPADLEMTFFNDGIHLNQKGQEYYSRLLATKYLPTISSSIPEKIRHFDVLVDSASH